MTKSNMYDWCVPWNPLAGECPHKCVYCLDGETLILMSDFTQKKIKDIRIGEYVVGIHKAKSGYKKFNFVKVTETFKRNADTIKITTSDSYLICTREHQLMGSTAIRNNTDWRQARMFSPYDTIKFITTKERGLYSTEQRIGYVRGVIDGDGCVYAKMKRSEKTWYGFDMVCIDEPLSKHVQEEVKSLFDIILRNGIKKVAKNGWGKDCPMLTCTKTDEVVKLNTETHFRLNPDFAKGYLAGMIDTDGSVNYNKGSIRIAQSKIVNTVKYNRILSCLKILAIPYVEETNVIRILSSFETRVKFLFDYGIYHSQKSIRLLFNSTVKGTSHSEVLRVEKHKNIEVYNIATESENYIANGFVVHNCSTNTLKKIYPAVREKYSGELRLDDKAMKKNLGQGKTWFVCGQNDLFAEYAGAFNRDNILEHCRKYQHNTYIFQTKNPYGYFGKLFPDNSILGCTIESNRYYHVSIAPTPEDRFLEMKNLNKRKFITIEPILDFDVDILADWMDRIRPEFVNIGADSKHHNLPEPTPEKVHALIEKIKSYGIEVREKSNLARLLK